MIDQKDRLKKMNITVDSLAKMNEEELNALFGWDLKVSGIVRQELSKIEIEQNLIDQIS